MSSFLSSVDTSEDECRIQFSDVEGLDGHKEGSTELSIDTSEDECRIQFSDVEGLDGPKEGSTELSIDTSEDECRIQFSDVEGLDGHEEGTTELSSADMSEEECRIQFSDVEGLDGRKEGTKILSMACIHFSDVEGLHGNQSGAKVPLSDSEDAEALHLGRTRSSDDHEAMEVENEVPLADSEDAEGLYWGGASSDDQHDDAMEVENEGDLDDLDDDTGMTFSEESIAELKRIKADVQDEGIMKILGTRCCLSDCTSTVSRKEALEARTQFQSKTLYEQRCWILQYLNTHSKCVGEQKHFSFSVGTAWVCMEAWRLVHGVGRKRLWEMRRLCQHGAKVPLPPNSHQKGRRKSSVHSALAWLKDFAAKCGDRMPDSPKIHLPSCHSRISVYEMMKAELSDFNVNICSQTHFLKLWREELPHLVIPSINRFAKCDMCTSIKSKLQNCSDSKQRSHLCKAREQHLQQQRAEREKYYKHQKKAKAYPGKYLSVIIDGMDQKSTSIPHFVQEAKSTNGAWKLPTHVTGGIVHGRGQHAFIDLNEFPHDPNLTITVLLRILQKYASNLPKVLYLQLDNCGRENKNKYVFAFLSLLVELEVFKKVKVSFLMVGHTHEDIDQFFSRVSTRLKKTNVPTLDALLDTIPKSFNKGVTTAERLQPIYSSKEWLGPCLEDISQHSRPHVFRITKGPDGRALISTKMWSSSPEWISPCGSPHLLTHHPDGIPAIITPNFDKVDLPRLGKQIMKMKPFLTAEAMETWRSTLDQLHLEDRGEAEFYCHWPLMDLLLTEEHENELCLQLSGSSSTYQSEVEEEVPCQVYIGQKKKKTKSVLTSEGNMRAFYLDQYHQEWPQIGRVVDTIPGELHVHWYTGTATSQWDPLTISTSGEQQAWLEWVQESAVITAPFELTRTSKLSGEMQAELKELRNKYIV